MPYTAKDITRFLSHHSPIPIDIGEFCVSEPYISMGVISDPYIGHFSFTVHIDELVQKFENCSIDPHVEADKTNELVQKFKNCFSDDLHKYIRVCRKIQKGQIRFTLTITDINVDPAHIYHFPFADDAQYLPLDKEDYEINENEYIHITHTYDGKIMLSFNGYDNVPGLDFVQKYVSAKQFAGHTVWYTQAKHFRQSGSTPSVYRDTIIVIIE